MKTPEIILIVSWSISLLYQAHLHGKERTGKHNFFLSLSVFSIMLYLYVWAGLFNN